MKKVLLTFIIVLCVAVVKSQSFIELNPDIVGTTDSEINWGDYDNDGDLDVLISGEITHPSEYTTSIYRNDGGVFIDLNL